MPDEGRNSPDPQDEAAGPPSARPQQSAASRARRIGGAAAAPRPAPTPAPAALSREDTAPNDEETVDFAKPQDAPPDDDGTAATRRRQGVSVSLPGWSVWTPAVALAAAAVVFLALFLVDRVGGDDAPGRSQATRTQVLAAAKTCLATLNTYRYDQLAAAEAAGVKCTTGKLTTDYKRTVTSIIAKNAPTLKSVQQATITTAGIESVTSNGRQWTVLAYGTLAITTASQKQGRNDPFAVIARLEQVGDSWRLAKIDTVSSVSP